MVSHNGCRFDLPANIAWIALPMSVLPSSACSTPLAAATPPSSETSVLDGSYRRKCFRGLGSNPAMCVRHATTTSGAWSPEFFSEPDSTRKQHPDAVRHALSMITISNPLGELFGVPIVWLRTLLVRLSQGLFGSRSSTQIPRLRCRSRTVGACLPRNGPGFSIFHVSSPLLEQGSF